MTNANGVRVSVQANKFATFVSARGELLGGARRTGIAQWAVTFKGGHGSYEAASLEQAARILGGA